MNRMQSCIINASTSLIYEINFLFLKLKLKKKNNNKESLSLTIKQAVSRPDPILNLGVV